MVKEAGIYSYYSAFKGHWQDVTNVCLFWEWEAKALRGL
jgi:hypothetical protein